MPSISLTQLPPELLLSVFLTLPYICAASALSKTCSSLNGVWRANTPAICNATQPRMINNLDLAIELYEIQQKTQRDHHTRHNPHQGPQHPTLRMTRALLANYRYACRAQAQLAEETKTELHADSPVFFRTWYRVFIIRNLCIGRFTAGQISRLDLLGLTEVYMMNHLIVRGLGGPCYRGGHNLRQWDYIPSIMRDSDENLLMRIKRVLFDVLAAAHPDWVNEAMGMWREGAIWHYLLKASVLPCGMRLKELVHDDTRLAQDVPHERYPSDVEGHIVG